MLCNELNEMNQKDQIIFSLGLLNLKEGSHHTRSLDSTLTFVTVTCLSFNLLSGCFYRILLFKNVFQEDIFSHPINLMTGNGF